MRTTNWILRRSQLPGKYLFWQEKALFPHRSRTTGGLVGRSGWLPKQAPFPPCVCVGDASGCCRGRLAARCDSEELVSSNA